MKYKEALMLKKGDLVIIDERHKCYAKLVLEIEEVTGHDNWCFRVTMKQPGVNSGFRITNYDTRHIQRFES